MGRASRACSEVPGLSTPTCAQLGFRSCSCAPFVQQHSGCLPLQCLARTQELACKVGDIMDHRIAASLAAVAGARLLDLPADQTFTYDEFVSHQVGAACWSTGCPSGCHAKCSPSRVTSSDAAQPCVQAYACDALPCPPSLDALSSPPAREKSLLGFAPPPRRLATSGGRARRCWCATPRCSGPARSCWPWLPAGRGRTRGRCGRPPRRPTSSETTAPKPCARWGGARG